MRAINAVSVMLPDFKEYADLIGRCWPSGQLTNHGPILREFEAALADYLKTENLSLFVNGHMALDLAVKSMGLSGEVITTPFTFPSTVQAITLNGLTPVFGDIEPDFFNLDAGRLEELITEKTSAIMPAHIFGHPCEVERLEEIADRHGLKLIYDAAQAFGVKIKGRPVGSFGDAAMFSLHAVKVFNAIEGGLLTFRDETLKQTYAELKNFGHRPASGGATIELEGVNGKMNEFQAAMGLLNLRRVDEEIRARRARAQIYIEQLSSVPGIKTVSYRPEVEYNYAYFPIVVNQNEYGRSRDELAEALAARGVGTRKLYAVPAHQYPCYAGRKYRAEVPVAEKMAHRTLDLPLYSGLNPADIEYISEAIADFRKAACPGRGGLGASHE